MHALGARFDNVKQHLRSEPSHWRLLEDTRNTCPHRGVCVLTYAHSLARSRQTCVLDRACWQAWTQTWKGANRRLY
eukprot:6208439-Pleurochrysis_carterae.AAC.2